MMRRDIDNLICIKALALFYILAGTSFKYNIDDIPTAATGQTENSPESKTIDFIVEHYAKINEFDSLGQNLSERYRHLTEEDFSLVARELEVETAAIKAVVEIEAGKSMKGFWAPGIPVINFDASMYAKYKNKVESKEGSKNEKVPEGLIGKPLKQWTRLIDARKKNEEGANMGTFWGCFR